jgi:hypothetical protein
MAIPGPTRLERFYSTFSSDGELGPRGRRCVGKPGTRARERGCRMSVATRDPGRTCDAASAWIPIADLQIASAVHAIGLWQGWSSCDAAPRRQSRRRVKMTL